MTLPQTRTTPQETKRESKPAKKAPKYLMGWELFNPHDVFETKELGVFCHFLNSKDTVYIELANVKAATFTLIIKGEVNDQKDQATLLFHQHLTNVKREDKIDIVSSVYALPGVGNIVKNRLGETLAAYLNVQKETAQG